MPMSWPSGPRNTKRKPPPTRRSTSQTTSDQPRGPNQRLSNSGFVNASQTRRRGASNTRVSTISRSVGVVTFKAPVFFITNPPLGFAVSMVLLFGFQLIKQGVEALEVGLPNLAITLQPSVGFRKR